MAQASIYPQFENKPFATLGGLLKQQEELEGERVKNDIGRQSIVESQTRVEKAGREAQDAQRKQAQQALAQDAFKRFSRPDGSVDQKAIIAYIQPQDYELAQTIATGFAEYQKKAMDARTVELDNENTQGAMIGNALQGVTPATYPAIWSRINSKDPEMGEFLGQQYDPEKINTALAMVTERGAWNTRTKDILSKDQTHINTALELLANSTDAEQAEDAMAFAKVHGVDDDLQQRGFGEWTPDTPQRAANLIMGSAKVADLKEQTADNERQAAQNATQNEIARGNLSVAQGNLAARRAEGAAGGSGGSGSGGAKLSVGAVEKIAGVDQSLAMLDDIERLLPSMRGSVGPMDGRLAGAKLKTGVRVNENLATFAAQITGLKNATIKALTGAAMSEPEAKRIMEQIPDLTNPEAVFQARLKTTRKNLELLKKRTIELSGGTVESAPSGVKPVGRFNPATGKIDPVN